MTGVPPTSAAGKDDRALAVLSGRLSALLEGGVALSALLLGVGALLLASSGTRLSLEMPWPGSFPWSSLAPDATAGLWCIGAGLCTMVATPIARVLLSLKTFLALRDRGYVGLLLAVLTVLAASALVGLLLPAR